MKERRKQKNNRLSVAHQCVSPFRMSPQTQQIVSDALKGETVIGPFDDAENALAALHAAA